jgi:hypothetical protein
MRRSKILKHLTGETTRLAAELFTQMAKKRPTFGLMPAKSLMPNN